MVVMVSQVGVAQQTSHFVNTVNGVTTGECAYINGQGEPIKIKFRQTPNGHVTAEANHPSVHNAVAELDVCKEAVNTVSHNTQQNIHQTQEQIARQHQQLQEQIRRQQEAIFNQRVFLPVFPTGPPNFP
ncbi:hypothetical protein Pmani_006114 [Petrolisthes manimaculis]|uniref:Uncharacterized protein n=1 Tax=Petrolisthes manimaculis TaxID=1843537 RepID=A0AAE1ULH7_9EUCA|nr:hypothetical protein Pmani_006114 [Petrolisthes manimaculis]